MEDMPIMEPPGGDCLESWWAAACTVWNAPERFVFRVLDQRCGVILARNVSCWALPINAEAWMNVLKELFELAYSCIANTHVQTSPFFDHSCNELLARLGVADVAWDFYEALLCFFFAAEAL
jgi:hypothetical protein